MKNILTSKIKAKNVASCWSGDYNGELVKPLIKTRGLHKDKPFGEIEAKIESSTTDGAASKTLWSLKFAFGLYTKTIFPKFKYLGSDSLLYDDEEVFELSEDIEIVGFEITYPDIDLDVWELVGTESYYYINPKVKAKFKESELPQIKTYAYKNFPSLEEIDSIWDSLIEKEVYRIEIKDDKLVLKVPNGYIFYDEIK